MDSLEFAHVLKGKQLQERRIVDWARFFVSRLLSGSKYVSPESVMKFKDEMEANAVQVEKIKEIDDFYARFDQAEKEGRVVYKTFDKFNK